MNEVLDSSISLGQSTKKSMESVIVLQVYAGKKGSQDDEVAEMIEEKYDEVRTHVSERMNALDHKMQMILKHFKVKGE